MCIVQRGTNYWHKHQHIAVASMTEGVCKEKHIEKHLQQFLGGFLLCVVTIEAPGIRQAIALRGRLFSTVSSPHSLFTSHTSRSQSCNQERRGRWFWWTSLENLLFWSFSLLIMACHLSEASLSRLKNTHTHTQTFLSLKFERKQKGGQLSSLDHIVSQLSLKSNYSSNYSSRSPFWRCEMLTRFRFSCP